MRSRSCWLRAWRQRSRWASAGEPASALPARSSARTGAGPGELRGHGGAQVDVGLRPAGRGLDQEQARVEVGGQRGHDLVADLEGGRPDARADRGEERGRAVEAEERAGGGAGDVAGRPAPARVDGGHAERAAPGVEDGQDGRDAVGDARGEEHAGARGQDRVGPGGERERSGRAVDDRHLGPVDLVDEDHVARREARVEGPGHPLPVLEERRLGLARTAAEVQRLERRGGHAARAGGEGVGQVLNGGQPGRMEERDHARVSVAARPRLQPRPGPGGRRGRLAHRFVARDHPPVPTSRPREVRMSATGEAAGPAGPAGEGRKIGKRSEAGRPSERLAPPTASGLPLPRVGAAPPTASGLALPRVPAPGAPPSGRLPRVPPPGEPSATPSGRLPRVPPPGGPTATPSGRLPRVPKPGVDIAWPVIAPVAAPAPVVAPAPAAGPEDGDDTAVLVILGGADAMTAPQVEAVGAVVKLTPYEVKLRFKGPVPRWGPVGPAAEILPLADALRAAGVDVEAIAADLILAPLDPVRVKSVRFEGEKVVLGGPRGEARIDLARPTLLVIGKVDLRASGDGVSAVGEARASVLFGHLYAGGRSEPFELLERDISDWSFLGEARSPVRRMNFEALLSRLATGPGVTRDDQLSVHHAKLKESALQGELLVGGGLAGRRMGERRVAHAGALREVRSSPPALPSASD
jgi:hypothetical protein